MTNFAFYLMSLVASLFLKRSESSHFDAFFEIVLNTRGKRNRSIILRVILNKQLSLNKTILNDKCPLKMTHDYNPQFCCHLS